MKFFDNPVINSFTGGVGRIRDNIPDWMGQGAANIAKIVIPAAFAYAGGAALAGALGGEAGAGAAGAEAGEGGYGVLEGMPSLGNGTEGGAMDMFGSQSSPTDASTVFDQSPHGPMGSSLGQSYKPQGNMGGGPRQPYAGPRPHDYLAYLQGQPPQSPLSPPMGQGTFWGPQQQSPMTKWMFGYG